VTGTATVTAVDGDGDTNGDGLSAKGVSKWAHMGRNPITPAEMQKMFRKNVENFCLQKLFRCG